MVLQNDTTVGQEGELGLPDKFATLNSILRVTLLFSQLFKKKQTGKTSEYDSWYILILKNEKEAIFS